ncbi:Uncharacterized protein PECH_002203 [Penicillium ucsense]|uniref:Uncharacterized protein n=1 Tax=Penicillium ucsense TaxID=2839758 RepID=A0A8J8WGT3_9EURO|nr:Uncharacterized protein PECM_008349 [Penicillium ucsense]KAF7731164.1 Uncharacterized protein PECH_002203 [Penicillium ucsense]
MPRPSRIHDLADELVGEILFQVLENHGQRALHGNRAGHRPQDCQSGERDPVRNRNRGEASDLDRFRLVCKRFMRIGTPQTFAKFTLRFSKDGFRRLHELMDMQRACYVRTVTYLARPFYQGSDWPQVLRILAKDAPEIARLHSRRVREQKTLLQASFDQVQLRAAIAAFTSLREIKLLRLQDEADEQLLEWFHEHDIANLAPDVFLDWESACSRAITSLGVALLDSQRTSIRFTGPQISPEATLRLLEAPSTTLAAMGSRLTSLDINFHAIGDITETMSVLSPVFYRFFSEARNLIAIHIGFPAKSPLNLDLEAIFHHIRWKTLRKLSLQGWRLTADEIGTLARRHRHQLREFRLHAVYLQEGSRWSDVLSDLRTEMEHLARLELREIDYAANFDALAIDSGVEIFEPYTVHSLTSSLSLATGTASPEGAVPPSFGSDVCSLIDSSPSPHSRELLERFRALDVKELGDDGARVHRDQVPLWETWVLSGVGARGLRI